MWTISARTGRSAVAWMLGTACGLLLLLLVPVQDAEAQSMAILSGRVVDIEEQGVPDATVTLEDPGRGFSRDIQTGDDGSFTLRTIPPGSYTLVVEKEGYNPYQGDVTLQAGAEMRGVTVTLAAPSPEEEAAELFQQGIDSFNAGDYEGAVDAFEQIVEMLPDSFEAHANLGQAYIGAGRVEDAVPVLERAVELDPSATETKLQLALTYSHVGRYEEAETVLQEALGQTPDLADPLMFQATIDLGNVYFAANRPEDAAGQFEAALEAQPESVEALLGLGKCRLQRERYEEAQELFQQVVTLAPAGSAEAQEAQAFLEALSGGGGEGGGDGGAGAGETGESGGGQGG